MNKQNGTWKMTSSKCQHINEWRIMHKEGLAGKTLIPFSTHEGSGLSGFDKKLSSACPDATVLDGLAIRGNDCQNDQDSVREDVSEWVTGLGY